MYTTTNFGSSVSKGWEQRTLEIMAVPNYKKFLEITSPYGLHVVASNPDFSKLNQKNNFHENCKLLELQGKGRAVSGWYLLCDLLFSEIPRGVCRLIHHCNLQLEDGSLINPTIDNAGQPFHLFLRDDARSYNLEQEIGYNDRMVFGDAYQLAQGQYASAPRNKVLFARDEYFSRDLAYERFKAYKTVEELATAIPKSLSAKEQELWLALKVA
jgi:hypothetical protein